MRRLHLDGERNAELALERAHRRERAAGHHHAPRRVGDGPKRNRGAEAPQREPGVRVRVDVSLAAVVIVETTAVTAVILTRVVNVGRDARRELARRVQRGEQTRAHAVARSDGVQTERVAVSGNLANQRAVKRGDARGVRDDGPRERSRGGRVGRGAGAGPVERARRQRLGDGRRDVVTLPQRLAVSSLDRPAERVEPPLERRRLSRRLGQRPVDPVLERAHEPRRDVGVVQELGHRAELRRGVLQLLDRDLHGRAVAAHVLHVVPLVDDHRRARQVNLQRRAYVRVEHVVVRTQHQIGVLVQGAHGVVLAPQVRLRDTIEVLHVPHPRAMQLLHNRVRLVVPPASRLAAVLVLGQLRALLVVLADGAVLLAAAEHRVSRGVGRALQLPHELVQLRVRARAQVDLRHALQTFQRGGRDGRELRKRTRRRLF